MRKARKVSSTSLPLTLSCVMTVWVDLKIVLTSSSFMCISYLRLSGLVTAVLVTVEVAVECQLVRLDLCLKLLSHSFVYSCVILAAFTVCYCVLSTWREVSLPPHHAVCAIQPIWHHQCESCGLGLSHAPDAPGLFRSWLVYGLWGRKVSCHAFHIDQWRLWRIWVRGVKVDRRARTPADGCFMLIYGHSELVLMTSSLKADCHREGRRDIVSQRYEYFLHCQLWL